MCPGARLGGCGVRHSALFIFVVTALPAVLQELFRFCGCVDLTFLFAVSARRVLFSSVAGVGCDTNHHHACSVVCVFFLVLFCSVFSLVVVHS